MKESLMRPIRRIKAISNARELAPFLNDCRGERGFERVEKAIEQINQYDEITRGFQFKTAALAGADSRKFLREARRLQDEINDFLAQSTVCFQLGPSGQRRWIPRHSSPGRPSHAFSTASNLVLSAVLDGYIRFIRKCPVCGTWFVAVKTWQKYCQDRCRDKAYDATPAGKAKNAEYQRRYRAGLGRRKSENLRVATRKRGH
jgi:hypothetical protein